MPFTPQADREKMKAYTIAELEANSEILGVKPGDRCFVEYKRMLGAWFESSRWTTADRLLSSIYPDPQIRARFLAYLVFFNFYVMPYEEIKRLENGEVEVDE